MGRARAFDADEALDRAMTVFWTKGYEGASVADLTEAMGINRPSLYATYGNKEELFRKALERYGEGPSSYERTALAQRTAREVAEGLLRGAADVQTDTLRRAVLPRWAPRTALKSPRLSARC
jgi:AcrR family transcriptional regulator